MSRVLLDQPEVKYIPIIVSLESSFHLACSFFERLGELTSKQRVHNLLESMLRSIFMPREWLEIIERNLLSACTGVIMTAETRDNIAQNLRQLLIYSLEEIIEDILLQPTKYYHYYEGRGDHVPNIVVFVPETIFALPVDPSKLMTRSDVLLKISGFSAQQNALDSARQYSTPLFREAVGQLINPAQPGTI